MARDQEKEDSVFDFLYIDSCRIALFLSQFSQYGHLTSLTRTRTESATSSGALDIKLAKIDGSESESSTLNRQFDAQWVAPLSFLDQARQRGMIKALTDGRIGNLVIVDGELEIRDLTIIKRAFEFPAMRTQMAQTGSETSQID